MLHIFLIWNIFGESFLYIFYGNVIDYILKDQKYVTVTFIA